MSQINFLAVVVAAISSFMLGGLWYSAKLFGKTWGRESGDTRTEKDGHGARVFAVSLLFALVAALAYAALIPPATNAVDALNGVSSQSGYSIGNVNTYAVGLIQGSQLSDYSTIKDNLKSSVQTELLSGSADLSSLYSTLGFNAASTKDYLNILNSGTSSGSSASAVDNYKKYLSSSTETSLLNILT